MQKLILVWILKKNLITSPLTEELTWDPHYTFSNDITLGSLLLDITGYWETLKCSKYFVCLQAVCKLLLQADIDFPDSLDTVRWFLINPKSLGMDVRFMCTNN